jgi:two-component system, OmpR family, KDP operon response regulator KdpE
VTAPATRVLVVDDEADITHILQTALRAHGYEVRSAGDGEPALEIFRQWHPQLIITDLSLPNMGGIAFCKAIRTRSEVPIIVLSVKNQEATKVQALECGADDYVTKPFGIDELLARIGAAMRRPSLASSCTELLALGDFQVDLKAHRVQIKGNEVHLTPKEFDLLTFLMRNAGRVLTHKRLLTEIWGSTFYEQPDAVRVLVRHLRHKIEPNPSAPKYLKTEPWIGYRFEPAP